MKKEWIHEEDGVTTVRGCAWSPPGCHPVGCGVKLSVKDGKLIKVEGDPEHPVTQGRLCVRCLTLKEYIYHPDRIIYPMKRAREDRGKDKWVRITWDEAFDTIVNKIQEVKKNYGPESIVTFSGTGREACMWQFPITFGAIGSPNACYSQSGWSCYGPRSASTNFILGAAYPEVDYAARFPDRYDHPGWQLPEYILLWGKAPLEANPDGFFGHSIIDMMRRGTKILMIDPRINWLATRAERVLQLRPGTDAALALGMLHVIINEDMYDHDFVDQWCYGFDELKERVQEYPTNKVAEITGVPKEEIEEFARIFAKAKPVGLAWGLPTDQNQNGSQIAHCQIALMALTGNLDIPGGITLGPPSAGFKLIDQSELSGRALDTAMGPESVLPPEIWEKRIGAGEFPAVCAALLTTHPDSTLDTLETEKPYPLKMAWFLSTNLISPTNSACPERWYNALKKLDFNVITDLFMTPTAMALADIFLPVASYAEHDSIVATHYGMNTMFLGTINKAIEVGECKSDIEIMLEMGWRLNPTAWPFKNVEEFLNSQLGERISFKELREKGVYQPDVEYLKHEKGLLRADGEPGFNTPTGKVELYSTVYESFGDDPLPYYREPAYSAVSTPELAKEYPLTLTTGARTFASFHSEHRQINSLRDIVPDPIVEIHPNTAAKLGINEGNWVYVENMFGKAQMKAHLTATIKPEVVHAQHGWWFPEKQGEEPSLFGVWESNINTLMPHKTVGKLGFGDTFKSILCKVYNAE